MYADKRLAQLEAMKKSGELERMTISEVEEGFGIVRESDDSEPV